MAKEAGIYLDATVREARGSGFFMVELDNGCEALVRPSGKMTKHTIKVNPDDRVQVELCPYDLGRGRIVYRYK